MSIGRRLYQARVASGLTQEQAAEKLCVSRQTISNWENDKTVPDVVMAQRITAAYGIQMNTLFMDEASMNAQYENSSRPISTRTGKERLRVVLLSYLCVWLGCILFFWIFAQGGGFAAFYAIFIYYIIFHSASAVFAFLFGLLKTDMKSLFYLLLIFGLAHLLLPYFTFSVASGNTDNFDFPSFCMGLFLGFAGMLLGVLVRTFIDWLDKKTERFG